MARKRGQKALYEAIGKAHSRASHQDAPEGVSKHGSERSATSYPVRHDRIDWKPKAVQFNYDRIELTLPYTWATGVVLLLVMIVLASFRLGQLSKPGQPVVSLAVFDGNEDMSVLNEPGARGRENASGLVDVSGKESTDTESNAEKPTNFPVELGNAVVIQAFHRLDDLVAVQTYFRYHGIDTDIIQTDEAFYLVTSERFSKARNVPGNRINTVIKKIAALGKSYKAKPPLDSFAPHRFDDAWPITFNDEFKGVVINVN